MPRFSLVIASLGRTVELEKLLSSLSTQTCRDFEAILVDQNADDRLWPLYDRFSRAIRLRRVRHEVGVSGSRNAGLEEAQGEFVAFPDDDCWYPPELLAGVASWFEQHPDFVVLAVGAIDESGEASGNRWFTGRCEIRPLNSLRTTFCSSLFIRRSGIPDQVRFDPARSRGEETDFVLRLLKSGGRGYFDRGMHVFHPRRDMLSGTVSAERAFSYGAGMGSLVRTHRLPGVWAGLVVYDITRAVLVGVTGHFSAARNCLTHTKGLIAGYCNGGR